MKATLKYFRFLSLIILLTCTRAHAAIESTITSLAGIQNLPIAQHAIMNLQDQWYPFPTGWAAIFQVNSANANVVLRYDDSQRAYAGDKRWTLHVAYQIELYDASGTITSSSAQALNISYDPKDGTKYIDRDMRQYANTHKAKLTIDTVLYNEWTISTSTHTVTNSHTVPAFLKDVYLDLQIDVERYYNITTASVPTLVTSLNSTTNELYVNWNYTQGAESYDLEWLFIDVGDATYPFTSSYDYDWRNATRVNVPNQHYVIPLSFPKGILLLRIRGVGIDWDNYVDNTLITRGETAWSSTATTGNTGSYSDTRYDIQTGLLPDMNWAYSAGFAEDGKRMDGAQFYDGMMRGRESVSNSDGNVIVSDGAYDFEGRPAVSYLPYPEVNNGIKFYPGNSAYNNQKFDQDGKVSAPDAMGTTDGSGAYYTTGTTSATGINGNTPDAGGYPYSRVTYMSDGTNRPSTSTDVGDNLKEGSGKETKYFYGTPSQVQLDRLFGNEVGYASHYKKNFTIDPNGVVSVSYIDQHGRVIATALAGNPPDNLQAIDNPNGNPNTSTGMTDDLLDNNGHREQNDGTEAQSTITVTQSSEYDFSYSLGSGQYCGSCYQTCKDCKYDLEIMLFNDANDSIDINGGSSGYAIRDIDIASGTYTFSITLDPGTYRVVKTLTLNQDNLDQVRQDYLDDEAANHTCVDSIPPSPVPCAANCHEACVNHYYIPDGSGGHIYVDDNGIALEDQGSEDGDAGPMLIAACQENLCDHPPTPDPCAEKYKAMIDDMSPGGQYFDNLPDEFVIDAGTGLQTANDEWDPNGWLSSQPNSSAMLTAINNTPTSGAHSFTTWTQVRENWSTDFAAVLVVNHPEYCAWNYFCNWSCTADTSVSHSSRTTPYTHADEYAYEQATLYETDGNVTGSDGFYWNPLNMTTNTSHSATSDDAAYLPYGSGNTDNADPRFVGDCDISICDDPSVSAESTLINYLEDFYPAYDNTNTFIGYYSAWYVALDPDNIATGSYSSTLSASTIDFFVNLHGNGSSIPGLINSTPSAGQVTPYQFFKAAYFYYRTLVIEQGFVGDADVASCQATHSTATPHYDADGYLVASEDNPVLTPEGFTILYPHNVLIDIYGDGCTAHSMTYVADVVNDLIDTGAANPNGIDNEPPLAGSACSCTMLNNFITSHNLSPTAYTDIADSLNEELGSSYIAGDVHAWLDSCEAGSALVNFPTELTCNSDVGISDLDDAVQTNCDHENADLAAYNANFTYQNQLQNAADAYMAAYQDQCVNSANETFTVDYNLHEYYYTLYYYDQAGNLVKTIPPEGVNIINLTSDDQDYDGNVDGVEITTYRNDFRDGTSTSAMNFTPAVHDMRSVYAYNSLQQPIKAQQNEQGNTSGTDVWESGETSFWYDYLGRLVVSQNSKQAAMSPPAYSYTIYDDLGRISEVGQLQSSTTLATTDAGSRNSNNYYFYGFNHTTSPTALESWIAAAAGTKREVTNTYYDEPMSGINSAVTSTFGSAGQENLRNRVSSVVYDDNPTSASNLYADGGTVSTASGFINAFHYSYDVHGNVKAMVQETPMLQTHNQDLKLTTYNYDLVSGNVNEVKYQEGQRDEFDHKYEYDADNRLHESYSSRDGKTWEKESKQFYYATGGLARMEIGDKTVQGEDYVYTINGWLKGMNRNTIGDYGSKMDRDIGQDAESSSTNNNKNFGADAAGFTLGYWQANGSSITADYTPVNSSTAFEAGTAGTDFGSQVVPQYNGNIADMVTAMNKDDQTYEEVQGRLFQYDQLYRIKQSLAFHMDATVMNSNTWQASYTQDDRYKENFSYDWNGNIKTVQRYSGDVVSGTAIQMDNLTYNYASNSNLLTHIDDAYTNNCSGSGGYNDDLDDQSAGNYEYDKIGALIKDVSERINNTTPESIEWNPYGKMKAVHKDQANNTNSCTSTEYADADVEYLYTASQQRLCKIVKPHKTGGAGISDQDQWTYYWYTYDAGGQLMAVYKQTFQDTAGNWKVHFDVQEHDVYGSGRLGIRKGDDDGKYYMTFASGATTGGKFDDITYSGASSALSRVHFSRELGDKQYQLANHLGNVLVTVSDKRLPYSTTPLTATEVSWYTADVQSYSDYYVFGAAQPGRTGVAANGDYRYGFNGKENDPEVEAANIQDYGMRMYDPRVGRFFSADPLMFKYAYYTPYQFTGNNPICFTDLDGGERKPTAAGCPDSGPGDDKGQVFGDTQTNSKGDTWVWTQKSGTISSANHGYWQLQGKQPIAAKPESSATVSTKKTPSDSPNSSNSKPSDPMPSPKKSTISAEGDVDDPGLQASSKSSYEKFAESSTDGLHDFVEDFTSDPFSYIYHSTINTISGLSSICYSSIASMDCGNPRYGQFRPFISPQIIGLATSNATQLGYGTGYNFIPTVAPFCAGDILPVNGRYFPTGPASQGDGIIAFRYMSGEEVKAVNETDLLRGGNEGQTYFTKDLYTSASEAQNKLSLKTTPVFRVQFEILSNPSYFRFGEIVDPAFGFDGGGTEWATWDRVHVRVINVHPLGQ